MLSIGTAQAGCFVNAGSLNFGSYDVSDPFPRDSMLVLNLSCQEVAPRDISVSIGPSASSGSVQQRNLKWVSGADSLSYNLFSDPSRTQVWGDGTSSASAVVVTGVSKNSPQQVVVYGRIRAGQDVSAGQYSDTVVVTVEIIR